MHGVNFYYNLLLLQHDYEEIVEWYEALAADNPRIVKFEQSIGKSYEGRDMPVVTISSGESTNDDNIIYSQCQIHASKSNSIHW